MKRLSKVILFAVLSLATASAQEAREAVRRNPSLAEGIYWMNSSPVVSGTPAPKGYKPVYISHYARHGARYLVTDRWYSGVLNPLKKARSDGNLTPLGERLLLGGKVFYETWAKGRIGDLTLPGWEQHREIAAQTVAAFPSLFKGKPHIEATASTTIRSILSMQSFCLSLQKERPGVTIHADAGKSTLPWTLPERKENAGEFGKVPMPWTISPEDFLAGKIDCKAILGRLFLSEGYVSDPLEYCIGLYNFLVSDVCTEGRTGIAPLEVLTEDELYALWENDNLETYIRVAGNLPCYHSMLEDIVLKAEEDMLSGSPARLRFGHDIGVDALAFMMGIDGADRKPSSPDEVADIWPVWRTPMASTFLLVIYTSRKSDPIFKVILNGEEVSLAKLRSAEGPYYRWNDLKALVLNQ